MTLFTKAISVAQSCNTLRHIELARRYLSLAMGAGLEYSSVMAIYSVLHDKHIALSGSDKPPFSPPPPPTCRLIEGRR